MDCFRFFGLTVVVESHCEDVRSLRLPKDQSWPVFLNPFLILSLYVLVSVQLRPLQQATVSHFSLYRLRALLEVGHHSRRFFEKKRRKVNFLGRGNCFGDDGAIAERNCATEENDSEQSTQLQRCRGKSLANRRGISDS